MPVDSHCHLDHFQGQEQADVVARARAAGVTRMVTIGTRLGEQAATVRAIADSHDGVFATVLQPFMPGTMAAMLDQLGVPEEARGLAALATPLPAGTPLPSPAPLFRKIEDAT